MSVGMNEKKQSLRGFHRAILGRVSFFLVLLLVLSGCRGRDADIWKQGLFGQTETEGGEQVLSSSGFYFDLEEAEKRLLADHTIDQSPPQRSAPLTEEQRVADFNVLFDMLESDYPFFGLIERRDGRSWVSKRAEFEQRVRAAADDEDFGWVLNDILLELGSDHAKLCYYDEIEEMARHYSYYTDIPSIRLEYLMLNDTTVRDRYGIDAVPPSTDEDGYWEDDPANWRDNLRCEDLIPGKVAMLVVPEMLSEVEWGRDAELLSEYLPKIQDYPALVIDIRGNPGGLMEYWQSLLVPAIAAQPYESANWLFFRGGASSTPLLNELGLDLHPMEELAEFQKQFAPIQFAHEEDLKAFRYFYRDVTHVAPSENSIRYKGRIYVLTDERVYSAAEAFASFAKNSGFATLVGSKTGGDGLTLGMLYRALPNSGYVFTYTNALGYAPDGSANEEMKTAPDVQTDDSIGWIIEQES